MELKHIQKKIVVTDVTLLLIVPYGIETKAAVSHIIDHPALLIVPYGIETTFFVLGTGVRKIF